jgi:ABC-type antimicrobial peptide transport system ATPase subunit
MINTYNIAKKVMEKSLILIGNRGSGKSTIAKKIAT